MTICMKEANNFCQTESRKMGNFGQDQYSKPQIY